MLAYGFQSLLCPFKRAQRNPFWENRTRSGKTEPVLGKQNPFWQNRTRSGKTEPVLGKRNPFWENRTRSGKTEPVLAKQNPFWRNGTRSGETEPVLKKKRQPRFSRDCRLWTTANYVEMNVLLSIQSV